MRKMIFTLLLVSSMLTAYGQYYYRTYANGQNPGGLNNFDENPVGQGLDPSWLVVLGPLQSSPSWSPSLAIPFNFNFNGSTVAFYKVSSTGVLTFDTGSSTLPPAANTALPSASVPNNAICVWGLVGTGTNDNIVTQTFGTSPNRQHWIFFSSYSYPGAGSMCWNYFSIVLEETSNKIYIVDQRHNTASPCTPALTLGVQISSTSAVQVTGSPSYAPMATTDRTPADNIYYEFIPGVAPAHDMSASAVTNPSFLAFASNPFTISGDFLNLGTAPVTSFDFNYSINGGTPVTGNVTVASTPTNSTVNASSPNPWIPPATGNFTIEIWASNINGNPDGFTNNDRTSKSVFVHGPSANRVVLHEHFTSSSGTASLPANNSLRGILDANPAANHTLIMYPMTSPGLGDPYFTAECNDRRGFYGVGGFPRLLVDGQWNDTTPNYNQGVYDQFRAVPSFIDINATYTISDQTVEIDIELDPLEDNTSPNLTVFTMILEDTSRNNASTVSPNGETVWYHYLKKMVPSTTGVPLLAGGLTKGVKRPITHPPYTFAGNYRLPMNSGDPISHFTEHSVESFCNLQVLVFVQDIVTKEIFQSVYATRGCPTISATVTQQPDNGTNNGKATATATGGVGPYTYLWSDGQTTQTARGLSAGTYTVTVTDCSGCPTNGSIDVLSNVGIDDMLNAGINGMNIFPNPSNGTFTYQIDMNRVDDLAISLYDINGKVVYTEKAENVNVFHKTVSLENVSPGIYMLGVQTSTGQGYKRVVIK